MLKTNNFMDSEHVLWEGWNSWLVSDSWLLTWIISSNDKEAQLVVIEEPFDSFQFRTCDTARVQQVSVAESSQQGRRTSQQSCPLWPKKSQTGMVSLRWTGGKQHAYLLCPQKAMRHTCIRLASGCTSKELPKCKAQGLFPLGQQVLQLAKPNSSDELRSIQCLLPCKNSSLQSALLWQQKR